MWRKKEKKKATYYIRGLGRYNVLMLVSKWPTPCLSSYFLFLFIIFVAKKGTNGDPTRVRIWISFVECGRLWGRCMIWKHKEEAVNRLVWTCLFLPPSSPHHHYLPFYLIIGTNTLFTHNYIYIYIYHMHVLAF